MSEEAKKSQGTRKLYTPQSVQNRVIEHHLEGASNREIAAEEGIDRETVPRILAQTELIEMRAEQQSRLERLGFKAIAVYEEALNSQDPVMAVATATKILEGIGALNKRGLQGTIDDSIDRANARNASMLPEFETWFKRRKPRRMSVKTELQVVPARLIEGGSGAETDTPLAAVTPRQSPRTKDEALLTPSLFDGETDEKS